MRLGGRVRLMAAASVVGFAGFLVPAIPAQAGSSVPLTGTAGPRPPQGAVSLGAIAPRRMIHVDVTLNLPDPAAMRAYVAAVSDRSSPLFHHFLRRGQFGRMFGPSLATVAAVETALRAAGLSPGPVPVNRLSIPVTASAAAIERAFSTTIVSYRLPGGRLAYSNAAPTRVPAAIAPYVSGVLGLSNLYLQRSHTTRPSSGQPLAPSRATAQLATAPSPAAAGPRACAAARNFASRNGGRTANEMASHYGMSTLYGLGDLGRGVRVALAEFEPNLSSDINAYKSCYGIHNSIAYIHINGGVGSGPGAGGEAALDIENVMALAPGAKVDVYQAPNGGDSDTFDVYSAIVSKDIDQVVSTSWGSCELDTTPALITDEDNLFFEAAGQGQTVFAAAGDSGSTDCSGDGSSHGADLSVDNPASQPYVVGVGGTSIGRTSESVWNNSSISNGAGGGGRSASWCMPSYQDKSAIPGLISGLSRTAASCGTKVPYVRQVPDVSADADPRTGYVVRWNGSWVQIGGTSGAAPLWAAVAALIDDSPFCAFYGSGNAGVLASGLYAMVSLDHSYIYTGFAEVLRDVKRGTNDYTPSGYTGRLFPSAHGYDMASGLGIPLVGGLTAKGKPSTFFPGLAALMCRQYGKKLESTHITGVSPHQGPSTGSHKVTITGTGFLPIAGADMVRVGSKIVAAHCTSTTRCTVVLPPMRPRTVNLQISAEDFAFSPITQADRYRYR